MNALTRLLPKSWFRDIDYPTQDIEFTDAWTEADHPRDPDGKFTVSGSGAGPVPQLTKYAGPSGAKMKAKVEQHILHGGNPYELAKEIHGEASQFKSSNVAGYHNQLLKHLEAHYGVPAGSFGKAKPKKDGEPDPMGLTPAQVKLMEAEVQESMAEGEADPDPGATLGEASTPETKQMASIMSGNWPDDEKKQWIAALKADLHPNDDVGHAHAQAHLDLLSGMTKPAEPSWMYPEKSEAKAEAAAPPPELGTPQTKTQKKIEALFNNEKLSDADKIGELHDMLNDLTHPPNIAYAHAALDLLEKKPAAAQYGANSPDLTPDPGSYRQVDIHHLANLTGWDNEMKIKTLKENLSDGSYDQKDGGTETIEYANAWIKKLEAQQAAIADEDWPEPDASASQAAYLKYAKESPGTPEEKIAALTNSANAFTSHAPFLNKLINKIKGEAGITAADPNAAAPAAPGQHPPGKLNDLPPAEKKAYIAAIPMPGGPQAQQSMWEIAAHQEMGPESKIDQIKADIKHHEAAYAKAISATGMQVATQNIEYGEQLIDHLMGGTTPAPEPAPAPAPAAPAAGGAAPKHPLGKLEEEMSQPEYDAYVAAIPKPSGQDQTDMWEVAQHPQMTLGKKIGQLESDKPHFEQQSSNPAAQKNNAETVEYIDKLLNHLKGDLNAAIPTPAQGTQKQNQIHYIATDPFYSTKEKIAKIQEVQNTSNIKANVLYGESVLAALGGKPAASAAAPAAAPPAMPTPPSGLSPMGAKKAAEMHHYATGAPGLSHAAKLNMVNAIPAATPALQQYKAKVLAHMQATAAAAPKPEPPPQNLTPPKAGSNTQTQMHAITSKPESANLTNAEKIEAVTKLLATSGGSDGGAAETYANEMIQALGGQPTTVTQAKAAHAAQQAANAPPPAQTLAQKAAAAAPKTAKHGSLTAPPNAQVTQAAAGPDLSYALAAEAGAKSPPSTSSPESYNIVPSMGPAYWAKIASSKDAAAFDSYGGGGYIGINGMARGDVSPTPETMEKFNALRGAFYDEDTRITEDLRLIRGEQMTKAQHDAIRKHLESGVGTMPYLRTGFTSASIGDEPGYKSGANTWWQFTCKKGAKVLGIAGKVGHHEREVILNHGVAVNIYEMYHDGKRMIIKATYE